MLLFRNKKRQMSVCVFLVYFNCTCTREIYNADNCVAYLIVRVSYNLVYRITNSCPLFLYVPV